MGTTTVSLSQVDMDPSNRRVLNFNFASKSPNRSFFQRLAEIMDKRKEKGLEEKRRKKRGHFLFLFIPVSRSKTSNLEFVIRHY